jgi:hypothetical protein
MTHDDRKTNRLVKAAIVVNECIESIDDLYPHFGVSRDCRQAVCYNISERKLARLRRLRRKLRESYRLMDEIASLSASLGVTSW